MVRVTKSAAVSPGSIARNSIHNCATFSVAAMANSGASSREAREPSVARGPWRRRLCAISSPEIRKKAGMRKLWMKSANSPIQAMPSGEFITQS